MSFVFTAYTAVLLAAALVSGAVIVLTIRRGPVRGGGSFALMMAAACLWTSASALESTAVAIPLKVMFAKISFAGTSCAAPFFLLYALRGGLSEGKVRWYDVALAFAWPLASTVLVATNEYHGLMWSDVVASSAAGSNMMSFVHQPLFYVAIGYDVLLSVVAAFLLLRGVLRSHRLYRHQTLILIAGLVVFWAGFIFYLPPLNPLPGLDTPAVGLSVSGLLILVAMWRFRLFEVVPIARDVLIEKMADGLIVLDARNRIVDVNSTAREWFDLREETIGRSAREAFPSWVEHLSEAGSEPDVRLEVTHPTNAGVFYDLLASRLRTRRGREAGRLLVVRDISARRRAELEKERLITELQSALLDIKTLRGLLPICASCKRIRDDSGYWRRIEEYVSAHSEAQFSHSLCPECLRKLYPELAGEER